VIVDQNIIYKVFINYLFKGMLSGSYCRKIIGMKNIMNRSFILWGTDMLLGNARNIHERNNRTAFSMWFAPRPLLCNGAVNTPLQ
jgi:hypothetical protein